MQFSVTTLNRLVDTLADQCRGGTLTISSADPTRMILESARLATVALPFELFASAQQGTSQAVETIATTIDRTGEAQWAELRSAEGQSIAIMRVRRPDDPNASRGDLLVDRTDFQVGGTFELTGFALSLPVGMRG